MRFILPLAATILVGSLGCSSSDSGTTVTDTGTPATDSGAGSDTPADTGAAADTGSGDTAVTKTICDKYGGPGTIKTVSDNLVGELAADCRISTHFTSLAPDRLAHVGECLTIQLQAVTGCKTTAGEKIKYPANDSKGVACRDMKTTHVGLKLSDGDFDALVEDAVKVLTKAGVAAEDIATIGGILGSTKTDIVEATGVKTPTKPICK